MIQSNEWYTYEIRDDHVIILSCEEDLEHVEIPEKIEDMPVTELADYLFSGHRHESVSFPPTIRRTGRYLFYNCFSLRRLSFYNTIEDLGSGAFTGCHKISHLTVTVTEEKCTCFYEILSEIREELSVTYKKNGQEAHLIFPEYYEEGIENTPARILMTQVHGSGIFYRNCFVDREFHFQEYDSRFSKAVALERMELNGSLALGRLMYPLELSEKSRDQYWEFLLENQKEILEICLQAGKEEEFFWLMECLPREKVLLDSLDELLEKAAEAGCAQISGYLMEYRRKYTTTQNIDDCFEF